MLRSALGGRCLQKWGRLFYSGAGTSGRLGVLDASECPPTFRADPEQVQGIIAGGFPPYAKRLEGAEDNAEAGAEAVRYRGVGKHDVFIGIAARTHPVRLGWHSGSKKRGANRTTLLQPYPENPPKQQTARRHQPRIGPELLTGSTRLKSGTATKLILNIITTLAMVKIGKVVGNLMVDLDPSNTKLRDRAVRIVRQLTGTDEPQAREALENPTGSSKAIARLAKR